MGYKDHLPKNYKANVMPGISSATINKVQELKTKEKNKTKYGIEVPTVESITKQASMIKEHGTDAEVSNYLGGAISDGVISANDGNNIFRQVTGSKNNLYSPENIKNVNAAIANAMGVPKANPAVQNPYDKKYGELNHEDAVKAYNDLYAKYAETGDVGLVEELDYLKGRSEETASREVLSWKSGQAAEKAEETTNKRQNALAKSDFIKYVDVYPDAFKFVKTGEAGADFFDMDENILKNTYNLSDAEISQIKEEKSYWDKYATAKNYNKEDAEKYAGMARNSNFLELEQMSSVASPESRYHDANYNEYVEKGKNLAVTDFGKQWTNSTPSRGNVLTEQKIDEYKAAALVLGERKGHKIPEEILKVGANKELIEIYRNMNDNELNTLAYYIAKDKETGGNQAYRYVDLLADAVALRWGQQDAKERKGFLPNLGLTALTGLEQFEQGIERNFDDKGYYPITPYQASTMYTTEQLRKEGRDVAAGAMEFGVTAFNMAPSILLSTALSMVLSPAVGTLAGAGTTAGTIGAKALSYVPKITGAASMGLSARGNAYAEMINQGYGKEQATAYGNMIMASEVALQSVIGGISKLGGIPTKVAKAISQVDNALARLAIQHGTSFVGEATEEGLQAYLETIFKEIALGYDTGEEIDWGQIAYEFLLGGLMGGFFESPEIITSNGKMYIQDRATGKRINLNDNLSTLIYEAKKDAGSKNYKRATKLENGKKVSDAKVGALLRHMVEDGQISEADATKLVSEGLNGVPLDKAEQVYYYAGANGLSIQDTVELNSNLTVDPDRAIAAWQMGAKLYEERKGKADTSAPTTPVKTKKDKKRFYPEYTYYGSLDEPTVSLSESKYSKFRTNKPLTELEEDLVGIYAITGEIPETVLNKYAKSVWNGTTLEKAEFTEEDSKAYDFIREQESDDSLFLEYEDSWWGKLNELNPERFSNDIKKSERKQVVKDFLHMYDYGKAEQKVSDFYKNISALKEEIIRLTKEDYDGIEAYVGNEEYFYKPRTEEGKSDLTKLEDFEHKDRTETTAVKNPVRSIVRENYNEAAEEFRTEENAEMFDVAYNQGLLGEKLNLGVIVPDKDISAVSQAYVAGTRDARIIAERRANFDNRTPGLFTDAVTEQLSKKFGSRTINAIDALGKKLGVQIRFIQRGEAGHEKDSYYSPSKGVIAINVNEIHGKLTGDKLIRFIANHEGVHRIRETSPKAYAEMEKIALSKSKQTVEERMARFKESKERATEEIVADYFGEVLTSKAEIKTLLNENRNVFDAIMEALEWLVDKMRGIANYSFSEIAEARKLFQEALAEADANVWGAEVRNDGKDIFSSSSITIDLEAIGKLKSIVGKHGGERVSVNDFTSGDIKAAEDFAKKYFEEMGVKSPFFRAWFGDWRVGDNGYSETVLHAGELRGEYQNKDTGWKLIVSRKIHKETNHHGSDKVKNAKKYLPYIKEITENAILLDSFVSEDENNLSAMYHKLYAYSEAYGYPALLKLTVEELIDEKSGDAIRRNYILHNIEEESLSKRNRLSTPNHDEGNSSRITISELFALVKQFDKEFKPKPSSLVVNKDGTPMVVYHQTENAFTVFDTSHKGAGTRDEETPFGVFLKPTKENIGIKGEIQMPLYAAITNPLKASDRGELVSKLKGLSDKYAELYDAHKKLDAKFKKEFDKATEDFKNYLIQWRKENPEASRRAIYEDENFEKMYGAEEKVLEEWEKEARALELDMKEEITAMLKRAKYDGVHIKNDAGSFGKKTETYIALKNTQVKSATDNIGTFNSENPDILWSKSEDSEDNVKYFPPGEDPRRDIKVPSEVNGKKVMRFTRTAAESPALTPEMAEDVVSEIENGRFYYTPSSNKALADNAMNKVENDVIQAASEWKTAFDSGKMITDKDIAIGEALIIEAGKRGDTERAIELISEVGIAATEAGKAVQAIKLLKRMTPEGQVYYLSKVVERLNNERGKTKGKEFNKAIEAENKATEADKKYKQAEAKVKTAEEKLFDIETAIEEYTKDLDIEVKIAESVEKIADLKKKLSETKSKVKSANASSEKLGGKIKKIEGQLEEERKKLNEAMAKRDAIRKERAEKGIMLSKLKTGVKRVNNATDHILGQIDILEDDISKVEAEYDKAVKFRDECAEERRRLIKEKNSLIRKTESADKASERDLKKISQLEEEISKLSDKYLVAKKTAEDAAEIRKQLTAERNKLRDKLERKENAVVRENEKIAKLKEEIAQLLNAEFEASKELEKAKEERTLMQKAKDKAKKLSSAAKMGANIIELPADIKKAILESKTEEELNESVELAKDYIAENMVATKAEMARAWRYLSMLGNLRTQVRNIIGNGFMLLNVLSKNVVATPIETVAVYASHKNLEKKLAKMKADGATEAELTAYRDEHYAERTKSWTLFKKKSDALKSFVTESWESNIKLAKGQSGKNDNIIGDINDRRTIFKSEKPVLKQVAAGVEAWRKATNWAMERGDEVFLKINYKHAMTSYILSNKWDVATMTETQKMRAEQYALKEAQEATFRDESVIADWINKGRNKGWAAELAIGGLMPFTKTPINITKRSIEYGPTGIVNSIVQGVKASKGQATSADVVNALAKTFSGSALAGLGFYLAAKGLLRSKGDEEDEEYNYLIGEQDYSFMIGDYRFSLEWAAPAAIPLLFGAAIYEAWFDKDGGIKEEYMVDENGNLVLNTRAMAMHKVMNATSAMFAPIFETSYMSGLTDSFSAAWKFGGGDASEGLAIFGINAGLSYANQFIPTVFGQLARTIDPATRRNNDYDKTSILPYSVQRGIEKSKNKIPFLNQTSTPYVNAWGEEEIKQGALDYILSFAENFVLPGYIEKVTDDELTDELWRLENTKAAEGKKVFPESVGTSFKDGETIPLTAEQRNERQKVAGQKGREYIEAFYNSDEYGKLTDAERVKAIDLLWSKANEEGIQAVRPDYVSKDSNVIKMNITEKNVGISPVDYTLWKIAYEKADEDENGSYNTDEVNAALDIFIELSGEEWTDEQLGYLWETRASALSKSNPYGRALLGTPWYQRKKEEGNTWMRERE